MTKTEVSLTQQELELFQKVKSNAKLKLIIGVPILLLFYSGFIMLFLLVVLNYFHI